jgi:S1-C subfamily serine protease
MLITNHHVVAPALGGGEVFVTSQTLGSVRPATVMATLGPLESAGGDFALLSVDEAIGEPLSIRTPQDSMKLEQVIAAGYPGFALETDDGFQALMRGDGQAAPGLVVTDGIVNAEQRLGPQTDVVMHTAHISPGNSGGPLVDGCGQVVGVNTFIRNDEASLSSLNFALASDDLVAFLRANGAEAALTQDDCAPALAPPEPAQE